MMLSIEQMSVHVQPLVGCWAQHIAELKKLTRPVHTQPQAGAPFSSWIMWTLGTPHDLLAQLVLPRLLHLVPQLLHPLAVLVCHALHGRVADVAQAAHAVSLPVQGSLGVPLHLLQLLLALLLHVPAHPRLDWIRWGCVQCPVLAQS